MSFLVGVGIGTAGSGDSSTVGAAAEAPAQPTVTVTVTAKAAHRNEAKSDGPASSKSDSQGAAAGPDNQATGQLPITNGDWRLNAVSLKKDFGGDFEGRARVTYIGDDADGGDNAFTLTVFKSGRDVASLTGFANTVLPGKTVTVTMISSDRYVKGPWTYDFQNDF